MKQFKLSVSPRTASGSRAAGRLRRSGHIPGVIYGKKSGSRPLAIEEKSLRALMRQVGDSVALVEVDESGKKTLALIQQVKRHAIKDNLMHIDFHEICQDEPLHVHVPVHAVGQATGVTLQGGILSIVLHSLDLKALPKNMPSSIEVDVSSLGLGQSIHVKDLPVMEGVTFLADPEAVLIACAAPAVEEEPAPVEEASESEAAVAPAEGEAPKAEAKK